MNAPCRRRLPSAEARGAALDEARALLLESGPASVTLKAVAARIGRSHATLLHHFGSAAGLQRALIGRMTAEITATIRDAVRRARAEGRDAHEVVDLVFDAFGPGGAGALASWMILTGNVDAFDPILRAIHDLVDDLTAGRPADGPPLREETLRLVLLAMGDALLGPAMARALELPPETARRLAVHGLSRG